MKFSNKLSFAMVITGIIVLVVISFTLYWFSYNSVVKSQFVHTKSIAHKVSDDMDQLLHEKVKTALTLTTTPVIIKGLETSNLSYTNLSEEKRKESIKLLNEKWKTTKNPTDNFIQKYTDNKVSRFLKDQKSILKGEYGEIFLTNKFGALVASTAKLSTFAHGHKYWWLGSYNNGEGAVFFDDRGYDDSVGGYVLGLVAPVRKGTEIIGILKCNLNILGSVSNLISGAEHGLIGKFKLSRSGGMVVFEEGFEPLSTQIHETIFKNINSDNNESFIINDSGEKYLVGFSEIKLTRGENGSGFGGTFESIDHKKGNSGESWYIICYRQMSVVLASVTESIKWIFLMGTLIVLILVIVSQLFGQKIAKPLALLDNATEKLGTGNFEYRIDMRQNDEFGNLARSFNSMAGQLQETTTSVEFLQNEVKQREQAEETLRESMKRYADLMESVPVGISISTYEGDVVDINSAVLKIFGYDTKEEFLKIPASGHYYNVNDRERFIALHQNDLAKDFEAQFIRKDGTVFWGTITSSSRITATGKSQYINVFQDISERKQANERIEHLNLVLRSIRNVNHLITKEKDRRRLLQGACDNLVENHGYYNAWVALLDNRSEKAEYITESGLGKNFSPMVERLKTGKLFICARKSMRHSDVVVTEDPFSTCSDCPLAGNYHGRGALTIRLEYEGKTYGLLCVSIPVDLITEKEEISLFKELADDIAFALYKIEMEKVHKRAEDELKKYRDHLENLVEVRTSDLTEATSLLKQRLEELRRAEKTLKESEERFKTMSEFASDCIYWIGPDGDLIYISPACTQITGYAPKEFYASPGLLDKTIHPDDYRLWDNHSHEVLDSKKAKPIEFRIITKQGSIRWISHVCSPIQTDSGEFIGIRGSNRDITKGMQVQMALETHAKDLARSNEELGQFAYVASHDLQGPLRAVTNYTQLLAKRYHGQLDEKADKFIDYIVDGTARMQNLINDLLVLSRVGRKEMPKELVDLEEVVVGTIETLKEDIENSGAKIIHQGLCKIVAVPSQIERLFRNIIGNAIKFRSKQSLEIYVSVEQKGSEHIVSIRDNGIGFEQEYYERIFAIFQRLHSRGEFPGTGIGLAICKKIVEQHYGRIWVESEPGLGTTFFFSIPKEK